jgi:hypothetical protein
MSAGLEIAAASAVQFAIGAVWYTFVFGKQWGKIHGFDKLSKAKQKELMSEMGPVYGIQVLVTIFSAAALYKLIALTTGYSVYALALLLWIGFIFPAEVSSVLFGGDDKKWVAQKIAIMAGASLLCTLAAAWVLQAL